MVDFGNKLKALRLQAGLTQKQLAAKIGVTHSVVSYYERQERYPSPEVLVEISRVFHVTTDYLLGIESRQVVNISNLNEENTKYLYRTLEMLYNKNE